MSILTSLLAFTGFAVAARKSKVEEVLEQELKAAHAELKAARADIEALRRDRDAWMDWALRANQQQRYLQNQRLAQDSPAALYQGWAARQADYHRPLGEAYQCTCVPARSEILTRGN